MTVDYKEYIAMKRKMEKYKNRSVKRLAVMNGLKPFVSKKVWDRVLDEVAAYVC